ncbi:PadR family transcriptional regulator [Ekhidna sp.]|uniref:PadR family transcriptional regulator n=1 Tax=Ekhidna sp. TaxID=2608089 RepID=UPI003BADBAA3
MKLHLGEFEEIVLLLVAAHDNDAYGLSIANAIEKDLDRKVTLSSVHTALYRMEEKGYLESEVGGATNERGGRSKRIFKITSLGRQALESSRQTRNMLWDKIQKPSYNDL